MFPPPHTPPTFSPPPYSPNFMFSLCLCVAVSHSLILSKEQKAKRKRKIKAKTHERTNEGHQYLKYIPVMLAGRDIELRLCQELANIRLCRQLISYALMTLHSYIVQEQPQMRRKRRSWLCSQETVFIDSEIQVSYNFVAQNTFILLFPIVLK